MLNNISGVDHVVVLVRDLASAAEGWRKLGFTISPRGTHSPHLGTGNHTIMLGPDYIELLAVLAETPHNLPSREFLASGGEGLERVAFRAEDAAAAVDELRGLGIAAEGPLDFGRPVERPDGGRADARFRTLFWPMQERPGGLRIFACQHLTPENVWLPELQTHANGARRILDVTVMTARPEAAARQLAHLVASEASQDADGVWRVPTGRGKADVVFLSREPLASRYPGIDVGALPDERAVGLRLAVADLAAAARLVRAEAQASGRVAVATSGIVLELAAA
jgi:hypothetical protein